MSRWLAIIFLLIAPATLFVVSMKSKVDGPQYNNAATYEYNIKNTRTGRVRGPYTTTGKVLNDSDDNNSTIGIILGGAMVVLLLWSIRD